MRKRELGRHADLTRHDPPTGLFGAKTACRRIFLGGKGQAQDKHAWTIFSHGSTAQEECDHGLGLDSEAAGGAS